MAGRFGARTASTSFFSSTRHGGSVNIYWMRADGAGEAVRLTESKNEQIPFSFSPDGKRLAFIEASPRQGSIYGRYLWESRRATARRPASRNPFS